MFSYVAHVGPLCPVISHTFQMSDFCILVNFHGCVEDLVRCSQIFNLFSKIVVIFCQFYIKRPYIIFNKCPYINSPIHMVVAERVGCCGKVLRRAGQGESCGCTRVSTTHVMLLNKIAAAFKGRLIGSQGEDRELGEVNVQITRPGFHFGAHKKRKVATKIISCKRYREILFQKVASGYLLHFVQDGSSKSVLEQFCVVG